jgi:hypothetical protein
MTAKTYSGNAPCIDFTIVVREQINREKIDEKGNIFSSSR